MVVKTHDNGKDNWVSMIGNMNIGEGITMAMPDEGTDSRSASDSEKALFALKAKTL